MTWFERPLRTRGYECDESCAVPLPVFLEYLENLRWECLLDPEFKIDGFIRSGHFFVVRDQRVEIVRRVGMAEDLTLRLWFERVGRSVAEVRHDVVRVSDGALVAHARVAGAFLSPNRRLARIPDEFRAVARETTEGPPNRPAPPNQTLRAVAAHDGFFDTAPDVYAASDLSDDIPDELPDSVAFQRTFVLRPSDNDIFRHVNAATYLRLFNDTRRHGCDLGAFGSDSDALSGRAVRVDIRHPREVKAGDTVETHVWRIPGEPRALGFCLLDPAGQPSCFARVDVEPPA